VCVDIAIPHSLVVNLSYLSTIFLRLIAENRRVKTWCCLRVWSRTQPEIVRLILRSWTSSRWRWFRYSLLCQASLWRITGNFLSF